MPLTVGRLTCMVPEVIVGVRGRARAHPQLAFLSNSDPALAKNSLTSCLNRSGIPRGH